MLERDVDNMAAYFGRFAPDLLQTEYGKEIWKLYEEGELRPDVPLTGHFQHDTTAPDVRGVLHEIEAVRREEERRLAAIAAALDD
jgi:RIO kinase 1